MANGLSRGAKFDTNVEQALMKFQSNMGLRADGKLGPNTQKQLNISAFARLETLRANLPRGSSRALREDIQNENVLYLGTEFAAWVSIDRGQFGLGFQMPKQLAAHLDK